MEAEPQAEGRSGCGRRGLLTSVLGIDHVELFVPDRFEAAAWYERVLGLSIVPEFRAWATDSGGPLMIAADDGTKLALFEGEPPGRRHQAGFRRVAFRLPAEGFLTFLQELPELLSPQDAPEDPVVDHEKSYSIYFADPWGHLLEVTTYDYRQVTEALERHRRDD